MERSVNDDTIPHFAPLNNMTAQLQTLWGISGKRGGSLLESTEGERTFTKIGTDDDGAAKAI
jgi:hypothetical protein